MKRWQRRILACTLAFALLFSMFNFNTISYADAKQEHWAARTIQKWQNLGFLNGDEQGNIAPDKKITRAEFMALVNRSQNYSKTGDAVKNFKDVNSNDWFYDVVSIALEAGYIKGTSVDTISPNKPITRQEAMTILARISNAPINRTSYQYASDSADVADWARDAVSTCINEGYIAGYDGKIFPLNNISRAEVIVMLDRKINNQRTFSLAGEYHLGGQQLSDVQILAGNIKLNNFLADNLAIDASDSRQAVTLYGAKIAKILNISAQTKAKVLINGNFASLVNNSPNLYLSVDGNIAQLTAKQDMTIAGRAKIDKIVRQTSDIIIKVIDAIGVSNVLAASVNSLEITDQFVLEDGQIPQGSLIDNSGNSQADDDEDDDENQPSGGADDDQADDDDDQADDDDDQPTINVIDGDKVVVDENTKILVKRTFQQYDADKAATAPSCQLTISNVNITENSTVDIEIYGAGVYTGLVKTISIDLEPADTPVTILKKIYRHATGKIGEQTYSCDAIVNYDDYATAEFVGDIIATEQNGTLINSRGLSFKFLNIDNLFNVSSLVVNGNLAEQRFDDAEIKLYPGLLKQEDDKYYVVTVKLTDKADASKSVEVAINLNDYLDSSTPLEDRLSLATYLIANTLKNDANYNARFTALKDVAENEITLRELSKQDVDIDISFEYNYPTDDITVIEGEQVVVDENTKILVKRSFQQYDADKAATAPSCQLKISDVNITANATVDIEIYGEGLYNGLVKTVSIDLEPADTPVTILKKIYRHATGKIGDQTYSCDAIINYNDYATAEFVGDIVATVQNGTLSNSRGLSFKFLNVNDLFDYSSYVVNGTLAEQRFDDAEIKLYPGLFKTENDKYYVVTIKLTDKVDVSKSLAVDVDLNSFIDFTVAPEDRLHVTTYGIANALNNDPDFDLRFAALNDQLNHIVTLRELSKQDVDIDISFEYAYPTDPNQGYTPELGDATDFKVDWAAFDYKGRKNKLAEDGENYLYIQFNKPANQADAMNLDNYYFNGKDLSKVDGAAIVGSSIDGLISDNAWQAVTIELPKTFRPGSNFDFAGKLFIKNSLKAEDGTVMSTDKILQLADTASDSNFRDQDKVFEALYTAENVIVNQLKQGRVNPEIGTVDGKVDSVGLMLEDQYSGAQVVPDTLSIKLYNNGVYSGTTDNLTLDSTQSNLDDVDVLTSASVFYGAKAVAAEKDGAAVKYYLINNRITDYYDIWHYRPSQWSDGWIDIYGYNNTIDECRSVVKRAYLNNPNSDHATLVVEHSEYVGRGINANGRQYEGNTVTLESAAGIDHNLKLITPQQDGMALKTWEYSLENADLLTENDLVRAIGNDADDRRVLDYGYLSDGDVGVAADDSVAVKIDNLNTVATDFKVEWAAFDDAPFGGAHDYLYVKFNKPADETAVKQLANYTFNGKNLAQLGGTVTNGIYAVTAADYEAITIELPTDTLDGPYQAYSTDLVLNSNLVASDGTAISSSGPLYFSYIKNETTREVVTGKELSANPDELILLIHDLNYDINYYSDPAHPDPEAVQAAQAKLDVISQYKDDDGKLDFMAMTLDYGSNEDYVPEEMIVKLGNGGSYLGARKRTFNNQHPAGFYFNAMALVSPIEDVAVNTGLDVFKQIEYVDGFKHVNDEHVKMKAFIINMVQSDADLVNADPDKIKSLDLCAPIIDTAALDDPNAVDGTLSVTFSEPVAADSAHQNDNGVKIIDGQQFNLTRTNATADLAKVWTFDVTNANQISKPTHLVAPDTADNNIYVGDINNNKLKAVNAEIENATDIAYDPDFKVEWAAFDNNGADDGNDYLYIMFNKALDEASAQDLANYTLAGNALTNGTVTDGIKGVVADPWTAITLTLPANAFDSNDANFATTLDLSDTLTGSDGSIIAADKRTLALADTENDGHIIIGNRAANVNPAEKAYGTTRNSYLAVDGSTYKSYIEDDMRFEAEYLGDYDALLVAKKYMFVDPNSDGKIDALAMQFSDGIAANVPEELIMTLNNGASYQGEHVERDLGQGKTEPYFNNMGLTTDLDDVTEMTSAELFYGMTLEDVAGGKLFLINFLNEDADHQFFLNNYKTVAHYELQDDARPKLVSAVLADPDADMTELTVKFSEIVYGAESLRFVTDTSNSKFKLSLQTPSNWPNYPDTCVYTVEKANEIVKDTDLLKMTGGGDLGDLGEGNDERSFIPFELAISNAGDGVTVQDAAVAKDIVDTLDNFASNTVVKTGTQQIIRLTVDEATIFASHDEEVFFTNGLSKTFTIDGQAVAADIFETFDNQFFGQNNIFFGLPTLFGIYYWQHDDQVATFTSLGAGVEVNKLDDAKVVSDTAPTAINVTVEDGTGTDLDADIATLQLKPGRWNIGEESAITLVFDSDIEGLNPPDSNPLEIDVVFDAAEYEATEIASQIANKLNNEHLFSDFFTATATANQVVVTTNFKGVESPIEISIKDGLPSADETLAVEWAAFDNNGSADGNDYLYIKFNKPVNSATAKDIIFNGKDLSTLSGVTVSEKVRGVTAADFTAITLTLPADSLDSDSADFTTTLSFKAGYKAADGATIMASSQTLDLADTVNDALITVGNAKDQIPASTINQYAYGTASGRRDKWDTVFKYIEPDMQFEAEYLGDYDSLLVTKEFVVGAENAANFDGKVDAVALKLASGNPTNLPETLSVKLANNGVYRGDLDTTRNYYNNMPLVSDDDDVDVFTSASIFIGMQVEDAQKQENGAAKDLNIFLINLLQDNRAGIRSAIRNPMYVIVDDARPMVERAWLDDPEADNTTLNVRFSEWVYNGNRISIKDGAQFNLTALKLPNIRLGYGRNQKYSVENANQINKDENILLATAAADFSDCDPTYNTNCSVYDAVYKIENAIGGPAPADETLAVEWAAFDNNGAADGNDYLYIMFNKALDETSAQDLANYTLAGNSLTNGTVTDGIKGVAADPWTAITLTLPADAFDSDDANFATTLVLSDALTGSDGSIIAADKRTLTLADTENDGHIIIGNRASNVDPAEKAYGTTRNSYLAVDGTTFKSYCEDDMRFEAEYLGDYDALLVAKKYMFVDPNNDGKVDALAMQFSDGITANVPEELIMTLNNGASYQGVHVERDLGQGKDEPYFNNMGIITPLEDVTEMTSAELFYGMTLEDVAGGKLFLINFLNEDADYKFFLNNYSTVAHYELQDDARPKLVSAVLADPNADTTELTVKFSEIVYGAEYLRFVTDPDNSKFKLSLQTQFAWPDYPDTCVYTVEKANEIVKDTDLLTMTGGSDLGDLGEGNDNVSFIPIELEISNAGDGTEPIANIPVIEKCDVPPADTAIIVTEDFNDFAIDKDATAPSCELTISDVNIAQAGGQFVLKIKDDDNGAQLLKTVTINLETGDDAVTIMQKIATHLLATLGQNTYTCDAIYVCDDVAKATFVGSEVGTGNLGVSLAFEALDNQFKPVGLYLRGKDAYKENYDQAELNVYAPIVEQSDGKYGSLALTLTNNDDAQKSYQTIIDFEQADYKAALDSAPGLSGKLMMVVNVINYALANDSTFTENYVLLPDASNALFIIRDLSGEDANIDTEVVFSAAQSTVQDAAVAKDIVDTLDNFASNTVAKKGTQQVISLTVDEDTSFTSHDEEVFFTNGFSKTFTIDGQVVAADIFETFDNESFGQNNVFFGIPAWFGIYYWQHDDQVATFTSLGAGVEVNKLSDAKLNSDTTPTAITVAVEDGTGTDLDADIATLQLKPGRWKIGEESAITIVLDSDIEGLNPPDSNPLEIDVVFDAAEYEATEIASQIANKLNNEHLFSDFFTATATANQVVITTNFKGVESPIEISIK